MMSLSSSSARTELTVCKDGGWTICRENTQSMRIRDMNCVTLDCQQYIFCSYEHVHRRTIRHPKTIISHAMLDLFFMQPVSTNTEKGDTIFSLYS